MCIIPTNHENDPNAIPGPESLTAWYGRWVPLSPGRKGLPRLAGASLAMTKRHVVPESEAGIGADALAEDTRVEAVKPD